MNDKLPLASSMPYWGTSKSSPDRWLESAVKLLRRHKAIVHGQLFGSMDGREAYSLSFSMEGDRFNLTWPVLPVKNLSDAIKARRQAAVSLYRYVVNTIALTKTHGARRSFFMFWELNGASVYQAIPSFDSGTLLAERTTPHPDEVVEGELR